MKKNIDILDEYYLAGANFFGISICFDPYKQEVVDSPVMLKGGDGGCGICGGEHPIDSYMGFATYFQNRDSFMSAMYEKEITGDYTIGRRIRRL